MSVSTPLSGHGFPSLRKRKVDLIVASLAMEDLYSSVFEGWNVGRLWPPVGPSSWQPVLAEDLGPGFAGALGVPLIPGHLW